MAENELNALVRLAKAVADPGRITMLKLMEARPLCVCELTHCLGLAQSTVSRHLQTLEEAGLVSRRRDGQWVEYSLAKGTSPYAADMLVVVRGWLADDEHLEQMNAKLRDVDRTTACAHKE